PHWASPCTSAVPAPSCRQSRTCRGSDHASPSQRQPERTAGHPQNPEPAGLPFWAILLATDPCSYRCPGCTRTRWGTMSPAWHVSPHASLAFVLVVAAHPAHGLVAFVAALGRAVKDRVVAHQELGAAGVAGVAVVEGAALARERAEPVSLGEIALEVGPGRPRVLRRDERQALTHSRLVFQQFQERELVRLGPRRG